MNKETAFFILYREKYSIIDNERLIKMRGLKAPDEKITVVQFFENP